MTTGNVLPETDKTGQLPPKNRTNISGSIVADVSLPLHGKLQANEQQRVFNPPRRGKRKIVFATNSAETSITIPGIKYVIDSGRIKEMQFDPKKNISSGMAVLQPICRVQLSCHPLLHLSIREFP
jgi:hypothetical protein